MHKNDAHNQPIPTDLPTLPAEKLRLVKGGNGSNGPRGGDKRKRPTGN
ncbi:MAG: hypothetical protein ACK4Q5_14280 [Saprospiraceae bacterium]